MKFTQEQIDFVKHCGEHFEVLIGGRGHSKTKQIIEQLSLENQELKGRIDNAVEIIEKEIEDLKDKKRMIMQILTPENGYLKTDVEYEIKRLERYLEKLKGDKE